MTVNINSETGIRYGVVSMNSLREWAWEEFEGRGTNLTEEGIYEEAVETGELDPTDEEAVDRFWADLADLGGIEEPEYALTLEEEGLELLLGWLGGAALVWVLKSPFTARARLCSPCAPNAGDLDSKCNDGYMCYTLPPYWFMHMEETVKHPDKSFTVDYARLATQVSAIQSLLASEPEPATVEALEGVENLLCAILGRKPFEEVRE